jgi:hypothetical protein
MPQKQHSKVLKSTLLAGAATIGVILVSIGCGNSSSFSAKIPGKEPELAAADAEAQIEHGFSLAPKNALYGPGRAIVLKTAVTLLGNTVSVPEDVGKSWTVTILDESGSVLAQDVPVGEVTVSLSKPRVEEPLTARFTRNGSDLLGRAEARVLFDLEAPRGSVNWWPAADADPAEVRWNFGRTEDIDFAKSSVLVCNSADAAQLSKDEFLARGQAPGPLPQGCDVVAQGDALRSGVAKLQAEALADLARAPQAVIFVLAQDNVGNAAVVEGVRYDVGEAVLVLEAKGPEQPVLKSQEATLDLALFRQVASSRSSLSGESWTLEVTSDKGKKLTINPFVSALALDSSLLQEGRQTVRLQAFAKDDAVLAQQRLRFPSNEVIFQWTVDSSAPVVTAPVVSLDGQGQLFGGTPVRLQWSVNDLSPIVQQIVESSIDGGVTWSEFVRMESNAQTVTKAWPGLRSQKTPKVMFRVKATDALGFRGVSPATTWREQFFNLAVLTKSVQCFWCHMRIVGDVGAIFPSNPPSVHSIAGQGFRLSGRFFSNVDFPGALMPPAVPEAQRVPNYTNSPLLVFPKNNEWPDLSFDKLRPQVSGLLQGWDPIKRQAIAVDRSFKGHLVLTGTAENPIKVSGEVLIEGDLVLSGHYTGLGTIYANNIFVPNDLVAKNSAFPFSEDEATAMDEAKRSITVGRDGLYLGAIGDVVVGAPESTINNGCLNASGTQGTPYVTCPSVMTMPTNSGVRTPYSWLPRETFKALGRRAVFPEITVYATTTTVSPQTRKHVVQVDSPHQPGVGTDDLSSDRTSMEVSRVDAFLYAGGKTQIRVYVNLLLNGGVMSPNLDLISTYTHTVGQWSRELPSGYRLGSNPGELLPINVFNGLDMRRNEIRFDWRLRAGGSGLEALKRYFE